MARWMAGDVEVQNTPTIMTDDKEAVEHAECKRRNCKEIHCCSGLAVIAKEGEPALGGAGAFGTRFIQRETVLSETSKPSMRSSPWMRGVPQVGFSAAMRKIKFRTCGDVCFLPGRFLTLETNLQNNRKRVRCQRTTLSDVTTIRPCCQPDQTRHATTQNNLSKGAKRDRGLRRLRTVSCWRKAKFSIRRLRCP